MCLYCKLAITERMKTKSYNTGSDYGLEHGNGFKRKLLCVVSPTVRAYFLNQRTAK